MQWQKAGVAGLVGATTVTLVLALFRLLGLAPNLEMLVGSLISGDLEAGSWFLGFFVHLVAGALFALGYAAIFEHVAHRADPRTGVWIGSVHAVLAGFAFALAPAVHPLIPEVLAAPGAFLSGSGPVGIATFVGGHLLYGAVVGALYRPVKLEHRRAARTQAA